MGLHIPRTSSANKVEQVSLFAVNIAVREQVRSQAGRQANQTCSAALSALSLIRHFNNKVAPIYGRATKSEALSIYAARRC